MSDKARELAEKALERIGSEIGYYAVNERRVQQFLDIFTQTIQQALDAQAAEVVALRDYLKIISQTVSEHGSGPCDCMVSGNCITEWCDSAVAKQALLTQPNTRAEQIMEVVERVKKLAAIKKRVKESEAIIKPIPSDFWPLIHDLADMGEALEGGD
jgi:hypothetical protein